MTKIIEPDLGVLITRFSNNAVVLKYLVEPISTDQARWKPAPEKWSILEVVNHLLDEEREDFRPRLEKCLRDPGQSWAAIAPQEWAVDRMYNERDLSDSLKEFLAEREKSVLWLSSLIDPNWTNIYHHPEQELSTGNLLHSWLAHDFLHIKQITRLHYDFLNLVVSTTFSTEYAGNW